MLRSTMEDNHDSKRLSLATRITIGAGLYLLWALWIMWVQSIKITSFVSAQQAAQSIEAYASIGGLVKAAMVFGPFFGIRAVMKKM